jgi:hypothetical protein
MPGLGERLTALRTADRVADRWWLALPLPYLALGIQTVTLFVVPVSAYPSWDVYVAVVRLGTVFYFGSLALALLGLYFDLCYVSSVSEWTPTLWYSSMFFLPVVGTLVCVYYLSVCSRRVGRR